MQPNPLTPQAILMDGSILAVLLLAGILIRSRVGIFQRYVIPASVIGGVIGLALGHNGLGLIPTSAVFREYTTVLIQIVFAALFIGRVVPKPKELVNISGAQTIFAIFNNLGQIAIGLGVVLLFGLFGLSLHPTFGMQLVLAFQGGVGIPTAFSGLYASLGWDQSAASAVGETVAVTGIVLGSILGLIIANIASRRGYLAENNTSRDSSNLDSKVVDGGQATSAKPSFLSEDERSSIGTGIVSSEALSPLAYAFGFIAIAVISGNLLKQGLVQIVDQLQYVPEFAFVLVTGLFVQVLIQQVNRTEYVDQETVRSIQGAALDFLIVGALSVISLSVVVQFLAPLVVMVALGVIFNLLWLVYLAPLMLPGAWLEKGVAEFGQGTGSTPIALMLLRTVDPEFETDAPDAFAMKMFLTSPTMIPLIVFISPLVVSRGPAPVFGAMIVGMIACLAIARLVGWWYDRDISWGVTA